jgi:hypothetical protein
MQARQWNTIAGLAVVVTLIYVITSAILVVGGTITFGDFAAALAPVVTALGGYMARMASEAA